MIKVMFVCHGNICRSCMAEMIFKSIIKKNGLDDQFYVDSSATSFEEIGNPMYPPARAILERNHITIEKHYAKRLTPKDYENFDYIICMDGNNIRNIKYIIGEDILGKVHLFKQFCGFEPFGVADPWYTGDFELCYKELNILCQALFAILIKKH